MVARGRTIQGCWDGHVHTAILKWITNKSLLLAHGTLLSVKWQPGWLGDLGENGYMLYTAESLCYSPETITTLLTNYTPIQSKKIFLNQQQKKEIFQLHEEPFHQRGCTDDNYMERCSISLSIKEIQIKTIIRHCYTPSRMLKQKMMTTPNAGQDTGKLGHSFVAHSNVKQYNHAGKLFSIYFKNQICSYHITQQLQSQAFIPEK